MEKFQSEGKQQYHILYHADAIQTHYISPQTGKLEREQIPLLKKIKLILLFNPLTEWIDTTHLMRMYMHDQSINEGQLVLSKLPLHSCSIS